MSEARQVRLWRAYLAERARPKRKRGGQPGNLNALKHGARTTVAIALERELSTLLGEVRFALKIAKPFIRKRKGRPKSKNRANE
ncbi:MAG: hypothetical protein WAW96_11885 [Alphaproteobacteria bacterium]